MSSIYGYSSILTSPEFRHTCEVHQDFALFLGDLSCDLLPIRQDHNLDLFQAPLTVLPRVSFIQLCIDHQSRKLHSQNQSNERNESSPSKTAVGS